ncbi:hypothetical protein RI367_002721 [Sorochytrium milnesiophthora]
MTEADPPVAPQEQQQADSRADDGGAQQPEAAADGDATHATAIVEQQIAELSLADTSATKNQDPTTANKLDTPAPKEDTAAAVPVESDSTLAYHVKEINFPDTIRQTGNRSSSAAHRVRILCQNVNGPCPLLAICNTLALRGDIVIPLQDVVTFERLTEIIGNYLLERFASNLEAKSQDSELDKDGGDGGNAAQRRAADFRFNFDETLQLIPKLTSGLDVNVRFDSVYSFELTRELVLFDAFNIKLVHGWTCDPQDSATHSVVVGDCASYNGLVNVMVQSDVANSQQPRRPSADALESKALIAQEFLRSSPSQLTYHGLHTLSTSIPDALYVLFRNNHFHCMYKRGDGKLYTLVTDLGYRERRNVVWETLDAVDGDSQFLNGDWQQCDAQQLEQVDTPTLDPGVSFGANEGETHDSDLALAMQLQQEEDEQAERANERATPLAEATVIAAAGFPGVVLPRTSYAIAQPPPLPPQQPQRQSTAPSPQTPRNKKKSDNDCIVM